jgi:hypothetical protein
MTLVSLQSTGPAGFSQGKFESMVYRLSGFGIFVFWFVATSWLVWHDIVPAWTAQDPPRVVASDWVEKYGRRSQFGVFDQRGRRVGGIWTTYSSGSATDREDEVFLFDAPLIGPLYLSIKSEYDIDGQLDEIDLAVLGSWQPIRIHGERYPSQFAFRIDAGRPGEVFKIDLPLAGRFSGSFRPFDAMPDLTEGQSWRMQVFNPFAAVTGVGDKFIPMLVRVTGRELILVDGQSRDCLTVEAPNVKAWVEQTSGVVWVQEVRLPVGGTYTIRYERYDNEARKHAVQRFASIKR